MTDNDFADPWGLPSTAETDDEGSVAEVPAEPPAASQAVTEPPPPAAAPEVEPEPEPEPEPDESVSEPPHDAADDVSRPPEEVPEEEPEPESSHAPSESSSTSSGPYSQVLAAASGLFGRSTTPTPPEPIDVGGEDEPEFDVAEAEETPAGAVSRVEDLSADLEATSEEVGEAVTEAADPESPRLEDVEAALSSLGSEIPEAAVDATDEAAPTIDESAETVSLDQIAAMASQLEVETPEPYEVSFGVHDDDSADIGEVAEEAEEAEGAETLAATEADETEISIDMDSAPSVFGQLRETSFVPEEEDDEPIAGGFDVGAVFHSEQEADEAEDDEEVEDADEVAAEEPGFVETLDAVGTAVESDGVSSDAIRTDQQAHAFEEAPGADSPTQPEAAFADTFAQLSDSDLDAEDTEPSEEASSESIEVLTSLDEETDVAGQDDATPSRFVDSGEVEWGARWHESAQGWVEDASGQATWRPIVTTASSLSEWEVDTYLGIVVGDAPVSTGAPMDTAMALSRQHAIRLMVDEALSRGAHAVIGVALSVTDVGSIPLATATGTAVTLKPGDA